MKLNLALTAAAAVCLLLNVSCGVQHIQPPNRIFGNWERKIEKNYTLGALKQVPVGEVMVSQKDYFFREVSTDYVEVTNDCVVHIAGKLSGESTYNYTKGERLKINGTYFHEGVQYRFIGHSKFPSHSIVGISPSGEVKPWNWGLRTHHAVPASTRFISASTKEVDSERGFINFEIIYTGKSGGTLNLMYREYTQKDLARPAFSQNLSYDSSISVVAFKNLKMEIASATNESISFYVRAD